MRQHFRAAISGNPDQPWKFLIVPFDARRTFGVDGEVPVSGTLNGSPYRSTLEPIGGGRHMMVVPADLQRKAHLEEGSDDVDVVMDIDDRPTSYHVPAQLRRALAGDSGAHRLFSELTVEDKERFSRWVGEPEDRAAKIQRAARAVRMLHEGQLP